MAVLYTPYGPYRNVPHRFYFEIRDDSGDLVSLAGADSEISKDGGTPTDCTNEATEITTGLCYLELTATEMDCYGGVVEIVNTNGNTYTYHFVATPDVRYIGTVSAQTAGTFTLNTTDQVGSATDGFYDGGYAQVISGTGAGQVGRWCSTSTTYNGTTKVVTLNQAFGVTLDATSVVQIADKYQETIVFPSNFGDLAIEVSTGIVSADVVEISGDTNAADNLESDYDGTGYNKTNSAIGAATDVTNRVGADVEAVNGDTAAAVNLEADYDGTGYVKTNSTVGTVTNVTSNVNANVVKVAGSSDITAGGTGGQGYGTS